MACDVSAGRLARLGPASRRLGLEGRLELAVADAGRYKLVLPGERNVRDIYTVADDLGVGIRRLDLKRDSLQDIFLRAMEGNHGGV